MGVPGSAHASTPLRNPVGAACPTARRRGAGGTLLSLSTLPPRIAPPLLLPWHHAQAAEVVWHGSARLSPCQHTAAEPGRCGQWYLKSFVPGVLWPSPWMAAALLLSSLHSGSVDYSAAGHGHVCCAWGRQLAGQGSLLGTAIWALHTMLAGGLRTCVGQPWLVLPPIRAMSPMAEVHITGACSSHREGADPGLAGGGQGYAYAMHSGHPARITQLSFYPLSCPHFFSSPTPPLTPLPLRGREGGVAWLERGVASPRQGRVCPGLRVAGGGQEGRPGTTCGFPVAAGRFSPDSCTIGFLSSRAIHWYPSQHQ